MIGIYAVIAELPNAVDMQIGKRMRDHFENGFYGYIGSALGGLEKRVTRHLGNRKRLHWHIDYLLDIAKIRELVYAETYQKIECLIAHALSGKLASKFNFGCSDCNCSSHLFFCRSLEDLSASITESFNILNLNPFRIRNLVDSTLHRC